MNKFAKTIIIVSLLVALVFFVTFFGILILIIASAIGIIIALFIEYAHNKARATAILKEKKRGMNQ